MCGRGTTASHFRQGSASRPPLRRSFHPRDSKREVLMHFRRIGLPLLLVLAAACAPATVVTVGVVVAVTPASALVQVGATQNFKATVFGTSDTAVAWSVQEATGGSVAADGTYTAPATAGTYHVVATSHADPTKFNAAAVSVSVPIVIALTPSAAALQAGASQKFQASVSGTTDKVVAWSVQEANGGAIAADGPEPAPTTTGPLHGDVSHPADPRHDPFGSPDVPG